MRLDIFAHYLPEPVFRRFQTILPDNFGLRIFEKLPELWNIDSRLALMAEYADYQQILSLSNPPIELLGTPDETPALARFANDALADVCQAHPDRFPGFIANLPMNNPAAAVVEANRVVTELGASGIQIYTNVLGKPLSDPSFLPIFETMVKHDLPVWIHPMRGPNFADYATEDASADEIWFTFGWPYETSAAITRLIFSGIFDKLPSLKIITHHMGGMIPYFSEKIGIGFNQIFDGAENVNPLAVRAGLKRPLLDYYRMLYADTAINGSRAAAVCGHAFFGSDHLLFASDAPFDYNGGRKLMSGAIDAVGSLAVSEDERNKILWANARTLLRLD
ncbi:MAG: amidohydrolase family protein [Sphingobium sp.]|uniref:amidohydrolase family protein n=1 Tax=Sphingobium sp. TaxID=1912891 RepID=UPI0029AAA15E|nr:amidohydrolase family protein [Sphingobium sp.]MDX3911725.1 amidohydrolase family protein [Sphingobium sp.]